MPCPRSARHDRRRPPPAEIPTTVRLLGMSRACSRGDACGSEIRDLAQQPERVGTYLPSTPHPLDAGQVWRSLALSEVSDPRERNDERRAFADVRCCQGPRRRRCPSVRGRHSPRGSSCLGVLAGRRPSLRGGLFLRAHRSSSPIVRRRRWLACSGGRRRHSGCRLLVCSSLSRVLFPEFSMELVYVVEQRVQVVVPIPAGTRSRVAGDGGRGVAGLGACVERDF